MLWAFRARKPFSIDSFLLERIFRSIPRVLMAHTKWLPGVWLRHSLPPVQDYEGWWLSSCHGSVAKHLWLKPEVSWVQLPLGDCQPFHFPLFLPHSIYSHIYTWILRIMCFLLWIMFKVQSRDFHLLSIDCIKLGILLWCEVVPPLTNRCSPGVWVYLQYRSAFQSSNPIGWVGFIRVG